MDINQGNLEGLRTAFNTIYNNAFEAAKPSFGMVAMTVPSSTGSNTYRFMEKVPGLRKWLGKREVANISSNGFVIENEDFELTIGVDRNDIEDDSYGVYNPLFMDMGQSSAEHPDDLVWPMLALGETTVGYDGQFFFDTDHPVTDKDGVVQSVSNFTAGATPTWYVMDASRAVKPIVYQTRKQPQFVAMDNPTDPNVFSNKEFQYGIDTREAVGFGMWQLIHASKAALTADNVEAAMVALSTMKGPNGRPLNLKGTVLVVRASQQQAARKIIEAENLANGETNVMKGKLQLHIETRLD